MIRRFRLAVCVFILAAAPAFAQSTQTEGILLLAHGGQPDWNQRVTALAASIEKTRPVEVAFGMASRPAIQNAVDALVARGVTSIVAVPLFVSSHSSVVTSIAYLLGVRQEMPADLKIFAKMNHGAGGHAAAGGNPPAAGHEGHAGHDTQDVDNTQPVKTPVPIRLTQALNDHAIVGAILTDRARAISTAPANEAVILVAHGPVPDDDNARWLADMKVLAAQIDRDTEFAAIEYLTVRDDAPKPMKDKATEELRALVQTHAKRGRRVLIVPLLLSYGGIEKGIRTRLDGLDYVMATQALMPDVRLTEWVLQSAAR